MNDLRRYELFGWDYESINPISAKEAGWYLSWIRKSGGPILELACGTGRLLSCFAEAGFKCTGIDLSPAMLSIARKKRELLTPDIRKNISLRQANIASFKVKGKFGTAIIADNSFSVLGSKEQQKTCLCNVHRHLFPGGLLLLAVRRHDENDFKRRKAGTGWSKAIIDNATGQKITRRVISVFDKNTNMVNGKYSYKVENKNGSARTYGFPFSNPLMSDSDYAALLKETGFKAKVYRDYGMSRPDGKTRMLCYAAKSLSA